MHANLGPAAPISRVPALAGWFTFLACVIAIPSLAAAQNEPDNPLSQIDWQTHPEKGKLGRIAEVAIPEGFLFAGARDTRKLMEMMQNPTNGSELGFLAPEDISWFIVFEFDDVGYVKDDEKDDLDADAMLKAIRAGTKAGNKERRKRGWPEMTILGWEEQPHYDPVTQNLVWAIRAESEGEEGLNYNTRRLGRKGVMSIALVLGPEGLASTLDGFNAAMKGFTFVPGETYAEFRSGDKIAQYGLTALVTGGAVAVAAKTGLLKWLWKGIVLVVIAIGAFFKRLFGGGSRTTS